MIKRILFRYMILLAILLLIPLVSAFGISSPYWDDNPLIMYPGQTRDFDLTLQNMVEEETLNIKATIVQGSEIANLLDEDGIYEVPYRMKNIPVSIEIKIPQNAIDSEEYIISIEFRKAPADDGKMVQMASGIQKSVPILIKTEADAQKQEPKPTPEFIAKEEPADSMESDILIKIGIGFLIVIIIMIFMAIMKKKNEER
jgi:hypothetical protein